MKLSFKPRVWHTWSAVLLSLPILLVAVTSLLISHGQTLGLRELKVNVDWLPGYGKVDASRSLQSIRALVATEEGLWIGTQKGLLLKTAAGVLVQEKFAGHEIRALVDAPGGPFVLTTRGLWGQHKGNEWKQIKPAPISNVFFAQGVLYALSPREGLSMTRDGGQTWEKAEALAEILSAASTPQHSSEVSLARLVLDLHTGFALLGRSGEWVWIDIVGITLSLLVMTGLYMWWSTQRRKRIAKLSKGGSAASKHEINRKTHAS